MTATLPQYSDFSVDILGRYICNGLDEALASADPGGRRCDGSSQEDARPFDVVIIGGGSFGPILAQHLFYADRSRSQRILVLEGGRLAIPEHIQNLPLMIPDLPVWGVPWLSDPMADLRFKGLAYCLGGRSVFFGGWSPPLLDTELAAWPREVRRDLQNGYYASAADLIGTSESNDFIDGPLHHAIREQLREGLNAGRMTEWVDWTRLPLLLKLRSSTAPEQVERLKLEAPLAVQSRAPKGTFPVNKFSALPILTKAARVAYSESRGDDVHRRFMVVPDCFVLKLKTERRDGGTFVSQVLTNKGNVPVPPNGVVVLALGTLESARVAKLSFSDVASAPLMGQNLMAHLRSNLTIRIDRETLRHLSPNVKQLGASALFVRGEHVDSQDGTIGHFHFQITASGLGRVGSDSEAELFKKIPDVEFFEIQRQTTDATVVITIRGIGEMRPQNPRSRVELSNVPDDFGNPRAFVTIEPTRQDLDLWDAMDAAALQVAEILNGGTGYEVLGRNRDQLGTTHHEAGTLWMGEPGRSVTDANGRFHDVGNVYAVGPALFPTVGSPNPMLTGSALARRMADHLVTTLPKHKPAEEPGFVTLFDGRDASRWHMSTIKNQPGRDNPGGFHVVDGAFELFPGTDLGMLWADYAVAGDFTLKLEWRVFRNDANSGVFVCFPDPRTKGYDNTAYVAIHRGFEVQIDNLASEGIRKTGAVYDFSSPGDPATLPLSPVGQWNTFVVQVKGTGTKKRNLQVFLNPGRRPEPVTILEFTLGQDASQPDRAKEIPTFIGLQTHTGRVAFRNVRLKT